MSFFQRVAHHVVNEVMVKGLANSKTFQRFAVRTDANLQQMKKSGTETVEKTFDEFTKAQTRSASTRTGPFVPPEQPRRGFAGFVSAFVKEVRKDIAGPAGRSW